MKRNLLYRLLGYALGAAVLRYALLQYEIWVLWSQGGRLGWYYPAWWIVLAAGMVLMSVLLFMPAVVPQRQRGGVFTLLRVGVAFFLLAFYWYWLMQDGWIFHDWVAHRYLGDCGSAHSGQLLLALLGTAGYASVPILGWQAARRKRWKEQRPPEMRRRIVIRRAKIAAIAAGVGVVALTIATVVLVRDPQAAQRDRIKSTFGARGAGSSYTAPRRVRAIPILGGALAATLFSCNIGEFSGIVAIDDPVENEDLQVLSGYRNLHSLTLTGSRVTDAGIPHLLQVPNLSWVNLEGCDVTDKCIPDLIRLPQLKTLFIEDTEITETGARTLKSALPDCVVIATDESNKN
jgi:hypothetical protein